MPSPAEVPRFTDVERPSEACDYAAVLALAGTAATAAAAIWPQSPAWLISAIGPVQLTQAARLWVGCAKVLAKFSRSGRQHLDAPELAALAAAIFALAWRETEIDNELWGVHSFSWDNIFDPSVDYPSGLLLDCSAVHRPFSFCRLFSAAALAHCEARWHARKHQASRCSYWALAHGHRPVVGQ